MTFKTNTMTGMAVMAGALATAAGSHAATCKDDTTNYTSIWGTLQRDLNYLPNNPNFVITLVGGNVSIIDSCTFQVSNFTLYPAPNGVQWYGADADDTKQYHISWDSVTAVYNPGTYQFTLNSDVTKGETPQWKDIQIIKLYGVQDKVVIAHANVNTDGSSPSASDTSGGTASGASSTPTSSGVSSSASVAGLVGAAVLAVAALL